MASPPEPPSDPKRTSSAPSTSFPTVDPDNPFVAFRRFADSQISSLLQSVVGLPSLFAQPDSSERWASIDDFMARRREAMIRGRDEWIGGLERDMQESSKDSTSKRRGEEMQKWGAFFDAQESDRAAARRGHDQLGWDGKHRTEAKTAQCNETKKDRDERFIVSTPKGKVNLKRVVDNRDEGQGFWLAKDDPRLQCNTVTGQDPFSEPDQAVSWLLTDDYSPLYLDRTLPYQLDPSFYKSDAEDSYFRGDYQLGDLYPRFAPQSVLRHDPRLASKVNWRAAFHDLLDVHHKGEWSSPAHVRNEGNLSRLMDPGTWISYLVGAGSLGSQWRKLSTPDSILQPYRFCYGTSSEAWAVSPFLDRLFVRDITGRSPLASFGKYETKNDSLAVISETPDGMSGLPIPRDQSKNGHTGSLEEVEQRRNSYNLEVQMHLNRLAKGMEDNEWQSYRPAFTEGAISLIRNPDTEQSMLRTVDRVLRLIENSELEDEVEKILAITFSGMDLKSSKMFQGWFQEADDRLRNEYFEEWKAAKKAVDSEHPDVYGVKFTEPENETSISSSAKSSDFHSSTDSRTSSFSSSSSYSYNSDSTNEESPTSIISTLTTVESRTLPDGRIETKRVLKKKFADGREENSESTETESARIVCRGTEESVPGKLKAEISEVSEPPAVSTQAINKQRGGWFWT